jgi:hypothetical protein
MVDGRHTDKEMVEHAEKHLIKLLSDPYYHEAYLRLLRKKNPLLKNKAGNLPYTKGRLAAKYQSPKEKKKARGRPRNKPAPGADYILKFEASRDDLTLIDICRHYIRTSYPSEPPHSVEFWAQKFSQKLRNQKKKLIT